MDSSNLQLSAEESAMVQDSHWLLTKNTIMLKAGALLGDMGGWLQDALKDSSRSADDLLRQAPKIARGENYKGLPYLMLDYPRYFGKEDVFAWRTMFWWGNFFSVTWQLKGKYLSEYKQQLTDSYERLANAGFRLCIGEDEWRHDFGTENYVPLHAITAAGFSAVLSEKPFCKLAVKIPLDQWNDAKDKLTGVYRVLLEISGI